MKKRFDIIGLALAAIIAASGMADARTRLGDVRDIVKKIKSTYNSTPRGTVRFEQTNQGGKSTGTLVYNTGDRYRLELGKQTMVSNGQKVWVYNSEKNQVVISKPAQGSGKLTPSEILTAFPGDYATELVGEQKVNGRAVWVVRCTPGSGKKVGDVQKATLYIDKSTYRFQQVEIESPSMGSVKIRILSATYGGTIPESRFAFAAPKGVRVVDLSR
jgi:outer membrane lipoprotein-sorting protein